MSKLIEITRSDTINDLKLTIKQSRDDAQKTRIRAIIRIKEGADREAIASEFVVDKGTVVNWVKAYNNGGTDSLKMSKGGRSEGNPTWDTEIFKKLLEHVENTKQYWSIPLMIKWIKDTYKEEIPYNTVWYNVTHSKFSYKSARPHPHLGSIEQQELFKKGGLKKNSTA